MSFNTRTEIRERLTTVYQDVRCDRCAKPLPPLDGITTDTNLQYDNVLVLEFHGGYGMFIDPLIPAGSAELDERSTALLCHECAHEFAAWLGRDVRDWHTHTEGSGQHDDHHTGSVAEAGPGE